MKQRNAARTIDYWLSEITNDLQIQGEEPEEPVEVRRNTPKPHPPKESVTKKTIRALSQYFLPDWSRRSSR
jgi:hypothetical protein